MKQKDFNQNASGKLFQTPSGYLAFIPAALPPQIQWTNNLLARLSEADRNLAQLAAIGYNFPVPHVAVRPFIRREAVLSSRIEGTQTSLQELFVYEARQLPMHEEPDAHEVYNYVDALNYGIERLDTLPVSVRLIGELHQRLMKGVRGEHATPGELRRSQNWIGPATIDSAAFVPPPVEQMKAGLSELEKFIHAPSELPPLVRIGLIHYQFEALHPFLDGNGRVGRLLISLLLYAWNLLPQPLLYLSAYFETHRQEYYSHLLAVSQKGAWEAWLGFFLEGISHQSADSVERIRRLEDIRLAYNNRIAQGRTQVKLAEAIDFLIGHPVVTVAQLQNGIGLNNYVAAQRYIDRLIEMGVLRQLGRRTRNRLFIAEEILDAIEGIGS